MKLAFTNILLWFLDMARISFWPSNRNIDKALKRDKGFAEVLLLLSLSLFAGNAFYLYESTFAEVFGNIIVSILAFPVLLIVYVAVLKKLMPNPKEAAKRHEALFAFSALAFSAAVLLTGATVFLPAPYSTIVSTGLLIYLMFFVVGRGIRLLMKISFARALGINLLGLLVAVPLFMLLMIFFRLLQGSVMSAF